MLWHIGIPKQYVLGMYAMGMGIRRLHKPLYCLCIYAPAIHLAQVQWEKGCVLGGHRRDSAPVQMLWYTPSLLRYDLTWFLWPPEVPWVALAVQPVWVCLLVPSSCHRVPPISFLILTFCFGWNQQHNGHPEPVDSQPGDVQLVHFNRI